MPKRKIGKGVLGDIVKSVAKQVVPAIIKEGSTALGNYGAERVKKSLGGSYNLASTNRVRGAGMQKKKPQERILRPYVPSYLKN